MLEAMTYRYRGHSVADAGLAYRTREEIKERQSSDPIVRVREQLREAGVDEAELDAVDQPRRRARARRRRVRRREPRARRRPARRRDVRAAAAPSSSSACARAAPSARRRSSSTRGSARDDRHRHPTAPGATEVMTYREALRLAMREELARDERVFVMGEEVGLFDGSYKVTAGLMDEFGPDRVRDTPISEEGFVGAGVGAAMLGERPIVEIMTINFLLVAMDQVVNHAAKVGRDVRRRGALPARDPDAERRRQPADRAALAVARGLVRLDARPQGRRAREPGRRQGPAEGGRPRRGPGARGREPAALQAEGRGAARPRARHADRPRPGRPRGHATSRSSRTRTPSRARSRSPSSSPRRASRPRSSTCARCARSTSRRSPRRSRARTARSASRRAGRATA